MKRLFGLILLLSLTAIRPAEAQQKCPRGFYDCKGACGWFIDMDHDGYCDYSYFSDALLKKFQHRKDSIENLALLEQQRVADSIANANHRKSTKTEASKTDARANDKRTNCPYENTPQCILLRQGEKTQEPAAQPANTPKLVPDTKPAPKFDRNKYDLLSVFFGCVLLYIYSWYLAKIKVIRKSLHRKIWNTLLLLSFLVSGLFGLMLVVQLNYQVLFGWFKTLMYWHVEVGIAMGAISILHILWHWKYFYRLFKKHEK